MDSLRKELSELDERGHFSKTIDQVQAAIDLLEKAQEKISANPSSAAITLAGLKKPVKDSFDNVTGELKEYYSAAGRYTKAVDKKFKSQPPLTAENDALYQQSFLINRAIAMHLLREGQFNVATTFIEEAKSESMPNFDSFDGTPFNKSLVFKADTLQKQFAEMYHILHQLRQERDLSPAILWARKYSAILETRGSNLEFELCRLQYVRLFMGGDPYNSTKSPTELPLRAWAYGRSEFGPFQYRYESEIRELTGAMAYWENIADSPYRHIFLHSGAWDDVASSFNKEFCSLLGLSADSPLFVAATAGAIALPVLAKVKSKIKANGATWTTDQELPFEVPLPPAYQFHSIFVCPVSKDQATDTNPPMMMPCGHVICKESLERISKGARFKCPYCPSESNPSHAKLVYL
ncbi:putative regulator of gluconeogenesis Rmd5 [Tothia fuscella]|uniref:GID complex catalytic subunit 2 n=1 Tax=Tothia fuscella TaxID=1048955 RepID=A0A9P4NR34_9PEZI|nr:putative regulator of gluconeogenesis Rmd5 [Tothia fuscella]